VGDDFADEVHYKLDRRKQEAVAFGIERIVRIERLTCGFMKFLS
jgi:hypothetical protein